MTQNRVTFVSICLLCLVILLGFGLRVVYLDNLPISLDRDEGINALDALQLFNTHWLIPFLQNNFGRETLFFYLQSIALWLYGKSFFSLRFVSVLVGTLTIPLVYAAGKRLDLEKAFLPVSLPHGYFAVIAATGLAVSYWHLYFSRLALRAILLPPLLLMLIWCFWRGWVSTSRIKSNNQNGSLEARRRWWLVAAGLLMGLSFYTYMAARLLPVLFAVFVGLEWIRQNGRRKTVLLDAAIVFFTAAVTCMPLILYFFHNPQAFGSRTQTISILNHDGGFSSLVDIVLALVSNVLNLLVLHIGGGTWLAHWPTLNLLAGLGFLVGVIACLYHLKKPVAQFLLLWWGIGFAPVILTQQHWDRVTTILRGIVAWPATYLISAIGLATLAFLALKWTGQLRSPGLKWYLVPALLLVFGGVMNSYNYFTLWATNYDTTNDRPRRIAMYLNHQAGGLVLVPNSLYTNSATNLLLQARYPTLKSLDAGDLSELLSVHQSAGPGGSAGVYILPSGSSTQSAFVLLVPGSQGDGKAFLLPHLTDSQTAALSEQSKAALPVETVFDNQGEPIFDVFYLEVDAPFLSTDPLPVQPIDALFGNDVRLTGYLVEPSAVKPGQTVQLFLVWQAERRIDGDHDLFIHVFHLPTGQRYGQLNEGLGSTAFLHTHRWPAGLSVLDVHDFTLPADAPDGPYQFEIGLYHRTSLERLPVLIENQARDDKVVLGKFRVESTPPPAPEYVLDYRFGDEINLIGVDVPESNLQPGQMGLSFTLHWQAVAPVQQDFTVFIHYVNIKGQLLAQQDNQPQKGAYPTSLWSPGEIVLDAYDLPLPSDLPPGTYTLRVGLYDPHTGQRLLTGSGQDHADLPVPIVMAQQNAIGNQSPNAMLPGVIIDNPIPEHSRRDRLGGLVTFLGYDLETKNENELELTLYWRCDAPITGDYVTSIRVLDKSGAATGQAGSIVLQIDRPPVNGEYPTSRWLPGQVIGDQFRLPIPLQAPPGEYEIGVGLYETVTTEPLLIRDNLERQGDDFILLEETVLVQ